MPAGGKNVRIGTSTIVFNSHGDKFLMGKRKGSHGEGEWAFPGGHIDTGEGESWQKCAARELEEETGLVMSRTKPMELITITLDVWDPEVYTYGTVYIKGQLENPYQEPVPQEKDKCEKWEWVSWEQLRKWTGAHLIHLNDDCLNSPQKFEHLQDFKKPSYVEMLESSQQEMEENRVFLPIRDLFKYRPDVDLSNFKTACGSRLPGLDVEEFHDAESGFHEKDVYKKVAARERDLAEREEALKAREEDLKKREKELQGQ